MKLAYALTAIVAGGMLAGCGGKSAVSSGHTKKVDQVSLAQGQEATLYPLAVGNEWTYSLEEKDVAGGRVINPQLDVTFKVVDVKPLADGKRATIEITHDSKVVGRQIWEVTSKGIFQCADGVQLTPYHEPMPVVLFPIQAGKKGPMGKWSGTGPTPFRSTGKGEMDIEYKGTELVSTEVSTEQESGKMYSAFAVESQGKFTTPAGEGQQRTDTWWVPNIGFVRQYSLASYVDGKSKKSAAMEQVIRLKSFSFPK